MKVGTDGILLAAWADVNGAGRILDIGTGTGLCALMLAQRQPNAAIEAVEIDSEAAAQAGENVANSPWPDRILVQPVSLQQFTTINQSPFDLILCNPPFWPVAAGTPAPDWPRQTARKTVSLNLRELLACVYPLLHPAGRFCVILPTKGVTDFLDQAAKLDLFVTRRTKVRPVPTKPSHRTLIELSFQPQLFVTEEITIEEGARHHYSLEYINLTRDFYLDF